MFAQAVVLITEKTARGAKGVMLTQVRLAVRDGYHTASSSSTQFDLHALFHCMRRLHPEVMLTQVHLAGKLYFTGAC
jgi:hypothetical protein